MAKIRDVGESELIDWVKSGVKSQPANVVGIGDDCAVIPRSGALSELVTTDLLVEGVHFLRDRISPRDLGYKSMAVNLSDIAAMGGTPRSAFLSLSLPGNLELEWFQEFCRGLSDLGEEFGVPILGGDTTGSLSGIVINLCVLGEAPPERIRLRSMALPGDMICVTDTLGDSAAGLKILLESQPPVESLLKRHFRPRPHVQEGRWLAEQTGVRALMDISDGIGQDLPRILAASQVGARVALEQLPISQALRESCGKLGWSAQELAVAGGEDYCLLVTLSAESFPRISKEFASRFGRDLAVIGEITPENGKLIYTRGGQAVVSSWKGFDHFRRNP